MSEGEYELPLDIQIQILKRLPIESVVRFTSVSKTWKSIIQSSRFIAEYNSSHIQPHQLLFVGYTSEEDYVDIFNDYDDGNGFLQRLTGPMSADLPDFKLNKSMGYSQGLFGFHCYNVAPNNDSIVFIWNPSIRKSVFIPVLLRPCQCEIFGFTVCNATDPTIVKITYTHNWQVEIFTLSTGSWRTLSNACQPRESLYVTSIMVVIDRFIHWIVYDTTTPEDHKLHKLILSFDITSEQFTELCLPPSLAVHASRTNLNLSKLRESLVVLKYDPWPYKEIGVWMMMEPGVQNSFRKLFTVKVPDPSIPDPSILGFTNNGQPILQMDVEPSKWTLLFYEPDSKCFKDIGISGNKFSCLAGSYMETLLLLDH